VRALVTGSCGQIGSRCLDALRGRAEVVGLDRRAPADVVHDLRTPLSPSALEGIDAVLHLAGSREDVAFEPTAAWAAVEANVVATANLLAAVPPAAHVVLVSSISAGAASAYGASKSAAEHVARLWTGRLTIARLAQVYGPGTDPRNGMYRMIAAARRGEAIVVDCRPDLRRDYIHVNDAARLLVEILLGPSAGEINVGSGGGVAIGELARLIAGLCGAPPPTLRADPPAGGRDYVLDTAALAARGLGPAIGLADGVASEIARLGAR